MSKQRTYFLGWASGPVAEGEATDVSFPHLARPTPTGHSHKELLPGV